MTRRVILIRFDQFLALVLFERLLLPLSLFARNQIEVNFLGWIAFIDFVVSASHIFAACFASWG